MEAVGLVASVLTIAGVAKTTIKGFSLLEEIRETQKDYRLLRREIEGIEAAALFAERRCTSTSSSPQSFEDNFTYQQLIRIRESLQEVVDEMKDVQIKCARDQGDDDSDAKKRKWLRYKSSLVELRGRAQHVKTDLIIAYQCDSSRKLAEVTRRLDMPAHSPADVVAILEAYLASRGQRLMITTSDTQVQRTDIDSVEASTAARDKTPNGQVAISQQESDSWLLRDEAEHYSHSTTKDEQPGLMAPFRDEAKLGCSKSCNCWCHGKLQLFRSAMWSRSLFGSWSGGYRRMPHPRASAGVTCACGSSSSHPWWIEYETPHFLWSKALQIKVYSDAITGLYCTLRPVRFLPMHRFEWGIIEYSADEAKWLIHRVCVIFPDDYAENGLGFLENALLCENYKLVEFLLELWERHLVKGLSRRATYLANYKLHYPTRPLSTYQQSILLKLISYVGDGELEARSSRLQESVRSGRWAVDVPRVTNMETDASLDDLDVTGLAPLHWAASRGDVELVQMLVDARADVNVRHAFGASPLMLAAKNHHIECMRVLLLAGCRVNHSADDGCTALHYAVRYCSVDATRLLLSQGADASVQNVWGQTMIHMLSDAQGGSHGAFNEILSILLEAGADMDSLDSGQRSAVILALIIGNQHALRLLISAGAWLGGISDGSKNLLHMAAHIADLEALRFLHSLELSAVSASIDLDLVNYVDNTVMDTFNSRLSANSWEPANGRRSGSQEISAFVLLYQGIRDRNILYVLTVLEQALESLSKGEDARQAVDLLDSLVDLKVRCHNHKAASWYRGIRQELGVDRSAAVLKIEQDVADLKAELTRSCWEDIVSHGVESEFEGDA